MIHLRCDHHCPNVLHVGSDSETKDEHQHNRHAKQDQHRTLVAQDVLGLFDDE